MKENLNINNELDNKVKVDWEDRKNIFLNYLLNGDITNASEYINSLVKTTLDIKKFYEKVVTKAMYEIGDLWEQKRITIPQEHLATAIVTKIMSDLYMMIDLNESRLKVAISIVEGGEHEIGARMICDILESQKWSTVYTGAYISNLEILERLKKERPNILIISLTLKENFNSLKDLIFKIRNEDSLCNIKILIGGQAFFTMEVPLEVMEKIDKLSMGFEETLEALRNWQEEFYENK